MQIFYPDYDRSILSVISSISNSYGVGLKAKTSSILDTYLKKEYKNIVLLVMDAMGNDMIVNNCPNGILNQNKKDIISSVFPSTTVAALNTFHSGLSPIEHGWLGWSLYFKEFARYIDVFQYVDSHTKEKIECEDLDARSVLAFETIYEKISKKTNEKVKTYQVWRDNINSDYKATKTIGAKDLDEFCDTIESLCKTSEQKYINAYWDNPDSIMHHYGCYSVETKSFMNEFEKRIQKFCDNLKGTNTLLIITADHGQIDIDKTILMDELDELNENLIMPPFIENRALSFFVKEEKKNNFEKIFNEMFKNDYILLTKDEVRKKGLFGIGNMHKKADDFIGDYIACGISNNMIWKKTALSKMKSLHKADHAGLTENEMKVPLIIFEF